MLFLAVADAMVFEQCCTRFCPEWTSKKTSNKDFWKRVDSTHDPLFVSAAFRTDVGLAFDSSTN